MTIAKAKTILCKDMRCRKLDSCSNSCANCRNYVTDEQIGEAESVVLDWIENQQEHIKQQQFCGSAL